MGLVSKLAYRLTERVFRLTGHTIHPDRFSSSFLSRIAEPGTVVDVGVGFGTYPLYEAFPKARMILVEPLIEYRNAIKRIECRYDCQTHYVAAGNISGRKDLFVDVEDLHKSSFNERTKLTRTRNRLERRSVEVLTLDEIVLERSITTGPFLLKVDTEGFELEALEGAAALLRKTDIVIAETSIARRFENSYAFEDLILFMRGQGFSVSALLEVHHPIDELRTRFADIVFKKWDGGDAGDDSYV